MLLTEPFAISKNWLAPGEAVSPQPERFVFLQCQNIITYRNYILIIIICIYNTIGISLVAYSDTKLFFHTQSGKDIFFFLVALCLCCARACSSCGELGLLFVAMRRLLIAVASPVGEHGL